MKYKKGLIFICLIICLFSIASVCASDINDTVIASEDQSNNVIEIGDENENVLAVEEQEVYNIGATEENELSATAGTFTDLANDIASSDYELNLTRDYIYSSGDSKYVQGIKIDKKITINGNGFTINGNNQSRAFFVSFSKVIINNISFLNCYSTNDGGAVYWTGNNGFLDNCNFVNCFSYSLSSGSGSGSGSCYGGAIYWSGSEGILRNCSFVNCTTFSNYSYSYKSTSSHGFGSSSSYSYGGAVYWNGVNGSLLNCQFIYCSSLSNSNFSSNIYLTSGSSSSYSYGGAVYWNGVNGSLLDCIYWNCSSNSISDSSYKYASTHSNSYGGAVYWNGVNGSLLDCIYWNCSSNSDSNFAVTSGVSSKYCSSYGGAICWRGVNGSLLDCNFVNCFVYSSTGMGGSVYWLGSEGILCNCSFVNCSSFLLGDNYCSGAIYWGGSNGSLLDCSFVNCSCIVEGSSSYSGGTVDWFGFGGLLCNCSFVNCSFVSFGSGSISYNGGTVYWSGSGGLLCNCSFINSSFSNSKSKYISHIGGTVYWSGSGGLLCNCSFINSFFSKTGSNIGGAIYWGGNNGSIFSCSFVNCCSDNYKYIFWKGLHGILMNCSFNGDKYNYQLYCYVESKLNSNLNIQVNNSNIYEIHKILINVAPILNNVTFKVSDTSKNIIVYESNVFIKDYFELLLSNLTRGNYSVKVEHLEDDFYSSNSVIKNFNVNGLTPNINSSDIKGILAGNNLIYNVTLNDDAKGTVSVSILNKTFEGNIIGGKCIININDIIGGVYEYIIKYSGDDKYNDYSLVKLTNVSFKDSTLDFNIHNVSFGDNIFINPIINSGPTGNITVFLDNIYYTNFNIGETATIENLKAGNYSITLAYNGDNYYAPNEKTKIVGVQKINSTLNVLYNKLIAGDTVINITLNNKTTGNITFFINNKNYTKIIVNGKTNICFNDLSVGDYNYSVSYPGDNNFNKNNISGILSIQSKKSNIYLSAYNVICGENISINYGGVFGLTSIIDIYVDENFIKNVSVGQEIKLSDMSAGKHVVKIICNSDGFYATCSNITNVTVFEKSYINLEVHDINFEDSIILKPIVTNGATGKIKIYVNNTYKSEIDVEETYIITNLNGGNHTIKVVYSGDDYFAPCENTIILKVNKINTTISVLHAKTIAGNTVLTITLNNKSTGLVTVNVNNKEYIRTLSSGKTNVYIYDLPTGDYNYTVSYSGDQNFNENILTNKINIQLKDSNISISSSDIYIEEIATINYSLTSGATGILSIYVNDNFVKNVSVGNPIELGKLFEGNYNVKVIYNSDGYFASCEDVVNFKVKKYDSNFNISTSDTSVSYLTEIYYELTEEATGNISVYLNNNLIKTIKVGEEIELYNLKAGNYTVKVVYSGDDYYAGSECSAIFEVKKIELFYFFNNDIAGKNVPFEFIITGEDATGYINLKINEMDYSNYRVTNGNSTIIINDLKAGSNNYTLYYSGDEKYEPINEFGVFYVDYQESPITVDIPEISWGDLFIINPTLPKGATGNIEILIDNISLTNMSVGKNYRYNALNGGKHNLTVRYSGDDYFSENETTFEFNIKRFDSVLTVNSTIWANPSSAIVFQLNEETTGLIKLSVNNKQYSSEVINGTCKIIVNNLNIGSNNLIINYTGDSKYNPIYTVKELIVLLKDSKLNVNINNIISGNNLVIKPTVASGATGTCKIYVDNTLKTTINVGSSYTLSKPSIGKHEIKIVFSGNSYFESKNFTTLFRVFTVYPIVANDMKIIYGTDNYFQAKFYDEYGNALANKYVQFNVNGTDYPVKTNSEGIATLNMELDVGLYNITSISILDEAKSNTLLIFHSVQAENIVIEYNSDYRFSATFLDENAKALSKTGVIFILDGVTQPMVNTDVDGVAILDKALSLGTHTITSINTITNENMTNHVVVVSDINSIINVQNITDVDYGENPVLTINVGSNYLNANIVVKITGDKGYSQEFSQKASTQIIKKLTGLNADKYTVVVKYQNNDKLLNINLNKTFNVLKVNPTMDVNIKDAYSGGYATITVNIADSNGTVSLKVGSRTFNEKLTNGRLVKTVTGLAVGNYDVEVLFEGDNNYNPMITTGSFKMYHNWNFDVDFDSIIILEDNETYEEDEWGYTNYKINIYNLLNDDNDVVKLFIDGIPIELVDEYITSDDEDDEWWYSIEFSPAFLSEGNHTWEIRYSNLPNNIVGFKSGIFSAVDWKKYGEFEFILVEDRNTFTIKMIEIDWHIKKVMRDGIKYKISTFIYDNVQYYHIGGLGYSTFGNPIFVIFNPIVYSLFNNSYYKIENGIITEVISEKQYQEFDGVYYKIVGFAIGSDESYNFMDVIKGKYYYVKDGFYHEAIEGVDYKIINGNFYTLDDEEIIIENFTDDNTFAVINGTMYHINDNYYQSIFPTIMDNLILIDGKLYPVVSDEYDYDTGRYKNNHAIIDGKLYSIVNGTIGSQIQFKQKIPDKDIIVSFSNSGSCDIILPNNAKGSITLNIAGKNYKFNMVNGSANIKMPNLANGTYDYIIIYSGDSNYESFNKTGSFTFNNSNITNTSTNQTNSTKPPIPINPTNPAAKTTITLKTVKVKKSAKKLKLKATLKQGNKALSGKKITFKFNGKKYTAKTNKKGIAKVIIKKKVLKKLKVGKKVKIQASYGNAIAKKTAKVKK